MSTTNHTTNFELSQYIGTDVTSYLSNYNSDMYKIDAQMKVNATAAANAQSDASAAVSAATTAASNASAAVSTANAANTAAEAAQTAATAAQTAAGAAETDAAAALRASASNTIGNLAPAYDATLTYGVGDLVTYVDPETNQGKLYKNIIPIEVVEEFNINKWDDVTTSEIFSKNYRESVSVTADGTATNEAVLNSLLSLIDLSKVTFESYLIITSNGLSVKFNMNIIDADNSRIKLSNVDGDISATYFSIISLKSGASYRTGAAINNTPAVSFSNHASDPADAGTYTFYY